MSDRLRRIGSWLLPFGSIPVALAVVAACEDGSSPNGGPDFNLDGSVPTFDAHSTPMPEAGTDADAGPQLVTVRVRNGANQPVAGATVVFGSAGGDVIQALTSDATGSASLDVPSGSQVTVAFGTDTSPRLLTITAVEPGDEIIALASTPSYDGPSANVSIIEPPDGGAEVSYYLHSTGECGTYGTPPLEYFVDGRCTGAAGKFPVIVDGYDEGGQIVGFKFAKGLTADGGTVTPTFGPWSTAVTEQTIVASNLNDAGAANTVSYGEIADGVLTVTRTYVSLPDDGGTTALATFQGRTGFPEAAQWDVTSRQYKDDGVAFVGTAVRGAAPAANATTTIDFGARLPEITESSFDAGTPARPVVSWTTSASLANADGTYVVLRWGEPIDGGDAEGSWTFVTPPGTTSVAAPALPPGLRAPGAQASYERPARVVTVEASFVNGYASLRKLAGALHPSEPLIDDYGKSWLPALPADGTVRFSAFTRSGD
ncbi:MAG TPA: Ig-like domain-containing protein [Labilithrix sp.]|nr:Ig-like domain-containing protein [Labilithrix sp.]